MQSHVNVFIFSIQSRSFLDEFNKQFTNQAVAQNPSWISHYSNITTPMYIMDTGSLVKTCSISAVSHRLECSKRFTLHPLPPGRSGSNFQHQFYFSGKYLPHCKYYDIGVNINVFEREIQLFENFPAFQLKCPAFALIVPCIYLYYFVFCPFVI